MHVSLDIVTLYPIIILSMYPDKRSLERGTAFLLLCKLVILYPFAIVSCLCGST